MTDEETQILLDENNNKLNIDPRKKYSDEFYEQFIINSKNQTGNKPVYFYIKRLFDIVVSTAALFILIVPFLVISLLIKSSSEGPVFFKSQRVGKNGKVFSCLKFRSMRCDAPPDLATSVFSNASSYTTKIGRFIRKTSIDELPQLINVLLGQMSIIGYRPLVLTESNCNGMRQRMGVLDTRPGISGYAQVYGRDEVYYKNKAIMDYYYVQNASIKMDLKLIFESVLIALNKKGNKG